MHKWTWSLTAVALLGLASGCDERRGENTAQLREGMQVRAAYDEDAGKYEATTVELLPGASAPQGK